MTWVLVLLQMARNGWSSVAALRGGIILLGATLLTVTWLAGHTKDSSGQIALENALSALDSTRKIAAGHDTVYARLLAQKDVELRGALATAVRSRRDVARAQLAVRVHAPALDTTATHRGSVAASDDRSSLGDSLSFIGPPVEGVVRVSVRDSTFYWAAHLRPSPVDLTVAISCGETGPEAFVHGPQWVKNITISAGQVDPKVCHPAPSKFFSGVKTGVVVTVGAIVTVKIIQALAGKRGSR